MATPAPSSTEAPAIVVTSAGEARPRVFRSVPTLGDLTLTPGVASTNFLLALLTLVVLILTAAIINQTLEENEKRIHAMVTAVSAPFGAVLSATTTVSSGGATNWKLARTILPPLVALSIAAFIYGLEEPGAGFNNRTLVLFLTYLAVFAGVTYAYDGTQLLMSRAYHATAVVRVFPIGVVVAIFAVILTRLTGFQPGLMYGFVAAHALISPTRLSDDQEGKQAFFPALALLATCIGAWLFTGPARSIAEDHDSWWSALPEGIAVGLFVTGLESLFFQMIPIQFMDGAKVLRWNKFAWGAIALVSGFLFWDVLLNDDQQSLHAVEQTKTIVALIVVASALIGTIALWAFFRALGPYKVDTPEAAAD